MSTREVIKAIKDDFMRATTGHTEATFIHQALCCINNWFDEGVIFIQDYEEFSSDIQDWGFQKMMFEIQALEHTSLMFAGV